MAGYQRPGTPATVERQLRQEAGFGCARCGHPYLEYHHIVPYAEDPHFRPEDMVALCGNCHPAVGKMGTRAQHEYKANPFNVGKGVMRGALVFDKADLTFKVGGSWFMNTPTILRYRETPIISCRLHEGQAKVSLNLLDREGRTLLKVVDNEVEFRIDDVWDFQYAHNWAVARYGQRDVALRMDFRDEEAKIEGKVWLGGSEVTLSPDRITLPRGNAIGTCAFRGMGVAIQVGEPGLGAHRIAVQVPE